MANVRLDGLQSLERRLHDPRLFKSWGQYLERRIVTAFRTETSPAGEKWADLKDATKKSKRSKNRRPRSRFPNKILRDMGDLYQSITSELLPNGVRTGTSRQVGSYSLGAIHQFGAPKRGIVARPFLPINQRGDLLDQDRDALTEITQRFVDRVLR